jgi:RNA polymerase sigma factor (sigma-70 family)
MEVSALKYTGVHGLHGRSPLLRLQSDDRLIAVIRRGNHAAYEALVRRYETRLLAFCRHLLGSREDAEDVLQEVFAAAFNAILADEREINVRPWLYRIARNRSLNHLRRIQAVGVDSMDVHFSDNGASTADKVHNREEFRLLVGDIHELPETQRTALLLREMEALSYEQIAEAMETSVPSVKSLLVRARVSLAEAAEARQLSCEQVRIELGEVAEGLRRRPGPLVRRHLRSCERCSTFRVQLRVTNKALAALLPVGPLVLLKKFALVHLGHSAGAGSGASVAGSGTAAGSGAAAVGSSAATAGSGVAAAGTGAVAGSSAAVAGSGAAVAGSGAAVAGSGAAVVGSGAAVAGSGAAAAGGMAIGSSGLISAGVGALATKVAAGLAATVIVTAGAVEVEHATSRSGHHGLHAATLVGALAHTGVASGLGSANKATAARAAVSGKVGVDGHKKHAKSRAASKTSAGPVLVAAVTPHRSTLAKTSTSATTRPVAKTPPPVPPGRTVQQTDTTILATTPETTSSTATPVAPPPTSASGSVPPGQGIAGYSGGGGSGSGGGGGSGGGPGAGDGSGGVAPPSAGYAPGPAGGVPGSTGGAPGSAGGVPGSAGARGPGGPVPPSAR